MTRSIIFPTVFLKTATRRKPAQLWDRARIVKGEQGKKDEDPLDAYCVNLNEKAKEGGIDPLIGREEEVARCIQVLARRRKNNPLLVGDPGVGKTAIAEGIARQIVNGKTPDALEKLCDICARYGRATRRDPLPW